MRLALPYLDLTADALSRVCIEECRARCCRGAVIVTVNTAEIPTLKALAAERGKTLHLVEDSSGGYWRHTDHEGHNCPFLEPDFRCGIYDQRPGGCCNFPQVPETNGCLISGWKAKPQVFLASVHGKNVPYEFLTMRDVIVRALSKAEQFAGYTSAQSVRVDHNRNLCVKAFLATPADYLLFIDDDMIFPEDVGTRLVAWEKPIVAGLYFQRGGQEGAVYPHWYRYSGYGDDAWGQAGHMYRSMDEEVLAICRTLPYSDWAMSRDTEQLIELDAAGTGCVLIHRSVFERMPTPWFRTDGATNGDMMFFRKAKDLGFPVFGDSGVICGHHATMPIGVGTFRRIKERATGVVPDGTAALAPDCNTPEYWDMVHGQELLNGYRRFYPDTDAIYGHLLSGLDGKRPVVVDFGCGRSKTYEHLRAVRNIRYIGTDFSRVAIEDNRATYPDAEWYEAPIKDDVPTLHPIADLCISSEVIEHLADPMVLLRSMWQVCKGGGIIAIGLPIGEVDAPPGEHVQLFDLDRAIRLLEQFSTPVLSFTGDGVRRVLAVQKPVQAEVDAARAIAVAVGATR